MLTSVFIIVFCAALLVYWFRYTCILLVRNTADEAESFSATVQTNFHFQDVQLKLRSEAPLDPLQKALQRDYDVLSYLLRHAAGLELEGFEERMLLWDYRLMQAWYAVTRTAAPEQARAALGEMASVLTILAGRLGQRAGVINEA
jgi:hypothetical protein